MKYFIKIFYLSIKLIFTPMPIFQLNFNLSIKMIFNLCQYFSISVLLFVVYSHVPFSTLNLTFKMTIYCSYNTFIICFFIKFWQLSLHKSIPSSLPHLLHRVLHLYNISSSTTSSLLSLLRILFLPSAIIWALKLPFDLATVISSKGCILPVKMLVAILTSTSSTILSIESYTNN